MSESQKNLSTKEIKSAIHSWLDARQKMMVGFNVLCLLKPFHLANQKELRRAIEEFCGDLIDYMSFGQFKIFEHLVHLAPSQPQKNNTMKHLLSNIFSSTIQGIEFHDKYMAQADYSHFEQDLSKLGEHLAHRLDWEDQLLEMTYELIYEKASQDKS